MTGRRIATVTVVVADYDEAVAWFTSKVGFVLSQDIELGDGKRWVTVSPEGNGARLLLAQAADERQQAAVGHQAGGRVFLFLETDDFARDHVAMMERGVEFTEAPRHEPYGTVAVFRDLCGNLWDLIEPAAGRE
jgi:catechol 2,3-dioxygenase-like lactoylglutathione lyase family enzyme